MHWREEFAQALWTLIEDVRSGRRVYGPQLTERVGALYTSEGRLVEASLKSLLKDLFASEDGKRWADCTQVLSRYREENARLCREMSEQLEINEDHVSTINALSSEIRRNRVSKRQIF